MFCSVAYVRNKFVEIQYIYIYIYQIYYNVKLYTPETIASPSAMAYAKQVYITRNY
jgi:hypothetical protein